MPAIHLILFARALGFSPPATTTVHSSFSVGVSSERAMDLTGVPFAASEHSWTDPHDYTARQDLAAAARGADTDVIRTLSARDAARGCNVVVLDPVAFTEGRPRPGKTWHLRYEDGQLVALGAFPSNERLVFSAEGSVPP